MGYDVIGDLHGRETLDGSIDPRGRSVKQASPATGCCRHLRPIAPSG